jgi:predicted PurR-regulated permease PerM
MPTENVIRQLRNIVIALAIVAALAFGAHFFQPIAIAILLAFILSPLVRKLEKVGLGRGASVGITIALFLSCVLGLSYVVGSQVISLADEMPRYEENILSKVRLLKLPNDSPLSKLTRVAEHVKETLDPTRPASDVRIVTDQGILERLREVLGPFADYGEVVFFILLMLFFLLLERESIGERIATLAGQSHLSVTTKSFVQIGERLSRYLASFSLVNLVTGLAVWLGFTVIGLPYAVLWGTIGGLLRYIPYIGPTVAFCLPVLFSVAHFDGWMQPLLVVGWYALIEVVTNALEPVLYGKSTGVTALGLVVSALFWTCLWGGLGLLLATPLSVCLVVLGSQIPSLRFFSTLLSEDVEVLEHTRLYQRLLRRDEDGANNLLDEELKSHSVDEVFDRIALPTLAQASLDRETQVLDAGEYENAVAVLSRWLDDISEDKQVRASLPAPADLVDRNDTKPITTIVGVAAANSADFLVLRMLNFLISRAGLHAELIAASTSPLASADEVLEFQPDLVLLSSTATQGISHVRYWTKRLSAQLSDTPLVVGLWNNALDTTTAGESLRNAGAHRVARSLSSARDLIFEIARTRLPSDERTSDPVSLGA